MAAKGLEQLAVNKKQDEETSSENAKGKGSLESIVKKLVKAGKEKGFLTYDQINKAIPAGDFSSEQIDDAMATFNDIGLQLVESEDDVSDDDDSDKDKEDYKSGGNIADDDTGRTDDPVRMYLREMGAVELLSREGEIAIAKRIEAGRELMIGGICESPLAIESIIAWYKALQDGDILLREVIDLDATYNDDPEDATADNDDDDDDADEDSDGDDEESSDDNGDDADDEVNLSLAAMEEELLPQVFEKFGNINCYFWIYYWYFLVTFIKSNRNSFIC